MALLLEIKVIARSSRCKLLCDVSGIIKCYVQAPPEKGQANKQVIDTVAKTLKLAKSQVVIATGYTSCKKLLQIQADMSYEEFLNCIGSGYQKTIG